jgi:glycosyltransferase involved in cell wall biosynthesis
MKNIPKISVIMSVYNTETYLEDAINSILCQSFIDFEFLIVDDFSTDNSVMILELCAKKDDRIKIFRNNENFGLTKNLNKLLHLANGEYIARMDADDISELNRFEKQIDFLENHKNIDIVGSFSKNINNKGEIIGSRTMPIMHSDIIRLLPKLCPISHPTVIFRKDSLAKIGFYNIKHKRSQDYDMWFRAAAADLEFHNIPEFLFNYRMDENYLSRKSFKDSWRDFKIILEGYKHINLPFYKYHFSLLTLASAFTPAFLLPLLRRIDPRQEK